MTEPRARGPMAATAKAAATQARRKITTRPTALASSARPRRVLLPLLCGLLIVLVAGCAHLAEGTFLLIGFTCNAAISTALRVAGSQLEDVGLDTPLELVQRLCRFLEANSLPVLAARAIVPLVNQLVRFVGSGQLTLPGGVEEFGEIVQQIAQLTGEFDLDLGD